MQSEYRIPSRRLLFGFIFLAAAAMTGSGNAQSFHGASIFRFVTGPGGAQNIMLGEIPTVTVSLQNADDFGDSQTYDMVFDMCGRTLMDRSLLSGGANSVTLFRAITPAPSFQSIQLFAPNEVRLTNSFPDAIGAGDYVEFIYTCPPLELVNIENGRLKGTAMALGWDNRDGPGGSRVPEPITLEVEASIPVISSAIGDFVWRDLNGNGVQDTPAEPGVAGVIVTLTDCNGSPVTLTYGTNPLTTGSDGKYLFTNAPPSSYRVRFSNLPAGSRFTTQRSGADISRDSDVNPATSLTDCFSFGRGETNLTIDAGIVSDVSGAIGDFVWRDRNNNGIQETNGSNPEPGIAGETVVLLDCNGNFVNIPGNPTTTGPTGRYLFTGLPAGNYRVQFAPGPFVLQGQGGNAFLDSDANPNTGLTDCITLTNGEINLRIDAGRPDVCPGVIGDFVWLDANCDGLQDPGEPGLPGLTVDLTDCSNPPRTLRSTTTDGSGAYRFTEVAAGNYRVRFHLPAGFAFTTADQFPDERNSDAFPPDGLTQCFQLACGEVNTSLDAGIVQPSDVGDFVWFDENGDGLQNGEPGIPDVLVELMNCSGQTLATTTTDGAGFYLFSGLAPGNYRVRFHSPSGYSFTRPNVGADDSVDSDAVLSANRSIGETACIFLSGCGSDRTLDAGLTIITNPPCVPLVCRAISDEFNEGGTTHAVWLPGIATDLVFEPIPGQFIENPDGTARMTGTVRSLDDPDNGFLVDVTFSGRTSSPPPGSPKKDLDDEAYTEDGGPVDTDTWYYYTQFSGTLTGFGDFAGGVLEIERTGPAFQVGVGANGKNVNFGASGWFEWTVVQQPDNDSFPNRGQGDFNVDIKPCEPTPPPCCVLRAISDSEFNPDGSDHAVWLPGIATDLVFEPNPGQFVENNDGTARLTGTVRSESNFDKGFVVEVTLSGRRTSAPSGSPKKDLEDEAYVEDGGPVDTDTWYYYTQFSGTFTGFGAYDGSVLEIERTGPAFQVGVGANNKNVNFGASGWFDWTVIRQPDSGRFPSRGLGDFNLDCVPCPAEVPRPAPAPRVLSYRALPSGETELTIQGSIGSYYVIEGSEDLRMWKPIVTLSNTNNVLRFRELLPGSRCYYRLKMMP